MSLALHWIAVREVGKKFRKFDCMCILIHQIATDNAGREKFLVESTISFLSFKAADRFSFRETVYSILHSMPCICNPCHPSRSLVFIISISCGSIDRTLPKA